MHKQELLQSRQLIQQLKSNLNFQIKQLNQLQVWYRTENGTLQSQYQQQHSKLQTEFNSLLQDHFKLQQQKQNLEQKYLSVVDQNSSLSFSNSLQNQVQSQAGTTAQCNDKITKLKLKLKQK